MKNQILRTHIAINVWWLVRRITVLILWLKRLRAGLGFIFLHSGTWLSCEETLPAHASFETQERDHNSSRWIVVCPQTFIFFCEFRGREWCARASDASARERWGSGRNSSRSPGPPPCVWSFLNSLRWILLLAISMQDETEGLWTG